MPSYIYPNWLQLVCLFGVAISIGSPAFAAPQNDARNTPLVQAIKGCSLSVVNLRGRKTVTADIGSDSESKQVNGMGTGVVIDSRGYVLTNYHVVQGVKKIEVTTSDRQKTTAKVLAHDPETDLAILKIDLPSELPTIQIGSSSDLMLAETVAAVGNAYGYEHTVTVGIISQLGRTVQVNEDQVYRNLIQTDASINPGNSGGPLLNLNGEMIGINVAVRIGAQGIAFAIPVDDALEVAADLMRNLSAQRIRHGLTTKTILIENQPTVFVDSVIPNSPAAASGISKGDRILSVGDKPVKNRLDFECALVSATGKTGTGAFPLKVEVEHGSSQMTVAINVDRVTHRVSDMAWGSLGMKLVSASDAEMLDRHPTYKRGLRVVSVRPGSPADSEGILQGDVLVAMAGYKTESLENLQWVLEQPDLQQQASFMFYILREKEPFWGKMRVAMRNFASGN
ncbi:trypsin-like peptidase domain-containing protein [Mariniblastus fucicola]|uniref:Periplasmic serine endoprotease DegP n=1 Tax=Mariniblastus fucicola TaxID=980251 RepID=A0A5B9PBH3_9BACT|nr:trypsin-like peptidase domain-containing protein [Mariniblastus fucicola]QEG22555.1 Periplasmic serine endoprotease DegP precursor [Mariniblastus fucicola]